MAQHRRAPPLARIGLLAGLLLSCGGSGDAAKASGQDEPAATPSAPDEAPKADASTSTTGRVCTKNLGPKLLTHYIGIIDVDGTKQVGIRTESTPPKGLEDTPQPLTLMTDDGKENRIHLWYPGMERGDLALDESAHDPKDPELLYMMAPRIYGDCKEWPIDPSMLLPPPDMEFGGGMMKAVGMEGVE